MGVDTKGKTSQEKIIIQYPSLLNSVNNDSRILIADGNLTLRVLEKDKKNNEIIAEIQNDFLLGERKNVNIPGAHIELDTITEKDRKDIVDFGVKHQVDFIALSFTRSAECVRKCRELLGESKDKISIIPKIEN